MQYEQELLCGTAKVQQPLLPAALAATETTETVVPKVEEAEDGLWHTLARKGKGSGGDDQ